MQSNIQENPNNSIKSSFGFTLTSREFNLFQEFIYNNFGINLTQNKRALFMGRIQKIMKQRGFKKVTDYSKSQFIVFKHINHDD